MNIFEKFLNKIDWIYNVNMSKQIRRETKVNILNFYESVDLLIAKKASLARFGDGEFTLMLNGEFLYKKNTSLRFQKANPSLKQRMKEILKDKDISKYNLELAIPGFLNDLDEAALVPETYHFWTNYLYNLQYKITGLLRKDYTYVDSLISRFYMDDKDKDKNKIQKKVDKLKELWDGESLLIVEGEGSRLGFNNDLFDNSLGIQRILCPNNDAFDYYDEILQAALKYGKDKMIIIALGPTATVLAYDIAKSGLRALDLGHIDIEYQWFLMGAQQKVAVKGKVVTEAPDFMTQNNNEEKNTNLAGSEVLYRIKAINNKL
ncbi:TPA: GT-D fold domain-containing glycosyltransferase [Elizabethkingia anophelis]|uniref:GT-D fold domain-containing glycosyltransferase n=1 Tax=Elizabethkingia anophelis TaxID=1117645 RepID=UPI002010DB34|nr:GT-D fold domain-containing glycosyltransferase [Elizabethkingia anophelis]MCL1691734.1 GT-D fold domain-containing glycosyltransferase [Elizabethkingia anophelis]MDV3952005.1 glycosyltransferase [Elizabethkingia anophelis]MDV4008418.1 glycosyltransferase [Elizabethkingia anophelis]